MFKLRRKTPHLAGKYYPEIPREVLVCKRLIWHLKGRMAARRVNSNSMHTELHR